VKANPIASSLVDKKLFNSSVMVVLELLCMIRPAVCRRSEVAVKPWLDVVCE